MFNKKVYIFWVMSLLCFVNIVAMEQEKKFNFVNKFCNQITNYIEQQSENIKNKISKEKKNANIKTDMKGEKKDLCFIGYLKGNAKKLYSYLYPKGLLSKDGVMYTIIYGIILCGACKNQYLVKKLLETFIKVMGKVVVDGTIITSRMILLLFEKLLPKVDYNV